jgi:hypothetical protein
VRNSNDCTNHRPLDTRTIDFGTEGCTLQNGNVASWKRVSALEFCGTDKNDDNWSFVNFSTITKNTEGTRTITNTVKSTELLTTVLFYQLHRYDSHFSDGKNTVEKVHVLENK